MQIMASTTNTETQTAVQASSNTSFINSTLKTNKLPYGWIPMLFVAGFGGIVPIYFVIWQNFKRINKGEIAKKFLIRGGIAILLFMSTLIFLSLLFSANSTITTFLKGFNPGVASVLVIWFKSAYLDLWVKENNQKLGFGWSILGWGVLGYIIMFLLGYILTVIYQIIALQLIAS